MRHRSFSSSSPSIFLLAATAMTVGCADGVVPVSLPFPSFALDLDAPRVALEEALCDNEADFNCSVLADLDATDGERSRPFSLPETFPTMLRLGSNRTVDVPAWFATAQQQLAAAGDADTVVIDGEEVAVDDIEDIEDAVDAANTWVPRQFVPLALDPEAMAMVSPEQLAGLTIRRAAVVVDNSSLSVSLPRIDVYLGTGIVTNEDGTQQPRDRGNGRLIAASAAHPADVDGRANVEFAAGAIDALVDALASEEAWIELVPAEDSVVLEPGAVADTLRRPGGNADLTFDLQLGIPVSVAGALAMGNTGTEGLNDL